MGQIFLNNNKMTTMKIEVDDESLKIYNEMKDKHKYSYSIFKFSNDFKKLIVDKTASPEKTSDDFLNDLPPNDVRIALLGRGHTNQKLYFIYWAPDAAPIRVKMFLAHVLYDIKQVFSTSISDCGLQAEIANYQK